MIRRRLLVVVGSVTLLLVGLTALVHGNLAGPANAATEKPNVVVFMIDDTSIHDGRLWGDGPHGDPALTPAIYDRFVANGVRFPNAIGETPLCCPARATLMTGLHTHNHGVKVNDAKLFNPAEHIGRAMAAEGYATYWIGKYLNKVETMSTAQWTANASGWTQFDVFANGVNDTTVGYYTDYTLFTKQGLLFPSEHSTRMIGDRAVSRFAATPANKPIFAVLSPYNTHSPHIPMPQFDGDARCNSMPPWNPPSYNEADVSDKPPYVESRPLYPYPNGWPLERMCEEMLGVDWMVDRVVDELAAEGRLENTMFIFTADNGMDWGEHRLELKQTPYSTPIPLYISWPAANWAAAGGSIDEHVSSIDLAPTICQVASCDLGPFPGGQQGPDGVSLIPLLKGDVNNLGRDALLETSWDSRVWAGVRTTSLSELGLWHYVKHSNGFKELYNIDPDADPWQLDNLAYDPAFAHVREALADRLLELLAEGRPDSTATLTIIQDSLPNAGDDFNFTGDLGPFTLDDDSNATLPRRRVFSGLTPGSYTVTQQPRTGWTLSSLTCPAGHEVDLANGTVTVNLLPGDQITCTFKSAGRRPDGRIAVGTGTFKGDNFYATSAVRAQTQRWDGAPAGQTLDFVVGLQNDSLLNDSFTVQGVETGSTAVSVTYLVNNVNVTQGVLAGTYSTPNLVHNASVMMVVRVTVAPGAPTGIKKKVVITQKSTSVTSRVDVVRAVITR